MTKYISKNIFSSVKGQLMLIERRAELLFCNKRHAHIDRREDYSDSLGVSISWIEDGRMGNIGIVLDGSTRTAFKVGVIKARDIEEVRYYQRATICSHKSLKYIYDHLDDLLEEAYEQWSSWSDHDLLPDRGPTNIAAIDIKPWEGPIDYGSGSG